MQEITLLDLLKLSRTLTSTIQAVLPVRLYFQFLQQEQILTLKNSLSYITKATLNLLANKELAIHNSILLQQKDASKKGG